MTDHTLHITGIDFERDAWRGHAIRGLRAAWDVLDHNHERGFRVARGQVDAFAENPYEASLVGGHEDIAAVLKASEEGYKLSEGVLTFGVDLEDTKLGEPEALPEEDDESGAFSPAAYQTALVHLAFTGGNWVLAYNRTYALATATEDASLWEEVRAIYMSVFTHSDGEDGPEGPSVYLVQ